MLEQAAAQEKTLSHEGTLAKIEWGFVQSERGEVVDGELFSAKLLADVLDRGGFKAARYVVRL